MGMARKWILISMLSWVFLGLALAGCGNSGYSNAPNGSVNASSQQWAELKVQATAPQGLVNNCDNPRTFDVKADGSFTAGPCHVNQNDTTTGHLTADELSTLNQKAQAVATQNLSGNPECQMLSSLFVSGFVDMRLQKGTVVRVVDGTSNNNSICYRGGVSQASDLAGDLFQLMGKYYPAG